MALVTLNPFRELENSFYRYNGLRNPGLSRDSDDALSAGWRPLANISETDSEYLIRAELPAVDKDDVEVTVNDGVVTIKGERRLDKTEETEQYHRTESAYGKFMRSFRLPADVDPAAIRAASKDGVLKVHLPKAEVEVPKKIEIEIH